MYAPLFDERRLAGGDNLGQRGGEARSKHLGEDVGEAADQAYGFVVGDSLRITLFGQNKYVC